MVKKSKLFRNLKPGDRFKVETGWGMRRYQSAIVTVTAVEKVFRSYRHGKSLWIIYGEYPWWFPGPLYCYSDWRCELES